MAEDRLTFIQHLEELRARIIKILAAVVTAAVFSYAFSQRLLSFLVKPVGQLVFIAPAEAFITTIKLSLFSGVMLASPVIIYQIWSFVSLGMKKKEKKYLLLFVFLSLILFASGVSFAYFVIIPVGIDFLMGFASENVRPMITVGKYVSFVGLLTLVFGFVFQLPLLCIFLSGVGLVTPTFLSRNRKHAIIIMFVAGAVFTPPDIITQCLLAFPLIVLYEISIVLSKLFSEKTLTK